MGAPEAARPRRAEGTLGDRNGVADPAGQLDIHPDRVLEGEGEQRERTRMGDVELDSLSRDRARLAPIPSSNSIAAGSRPRYPPRSFRRTARPRLQRSRLRSELKR